MNIENFKLVRDRIAAEPPEAFDMGDYIAPTAHPCGTSMCIAGHTMLAMGGNFITNYGLEVWVDQNGDEVKVDCFAGAALGLTLIQSRHLFMARVLPRRFLTTRDEAVAALDAMIEAGSIYALVDELGNVREGV